MPKSPLTWRVEKKPVKKLIPADYNPRRLSDKARADLTDSIVKFGTVEPLVMNTDGTLIGGHQRSLVYADLGLEEVDVMIPSRKLSAEEERELNLRLNKNVGEWDWSKLKELFDVDVLRSVGFDADELAASFDKLQEAHEDDFDADEVAESIEKPTAKVGDVWALGEHRIICGDSTQFSVYEKLFGNERADMIFTDPPYNVNYNHRREYGAIRKGRKKEFAGGPEVINDNKNDAEFKTFLTEMFKNAYAFTKDSAGIYVCHATKSQREFFDSFEEAGFHFSQTIIWLKERILLSLGQDFQRVYEPIMYGWKEGKPRWSNHKTQNEKEVWDPDRITFEERLDVWYLHRDKSRDYIHPTQKPVRLPERGIKKSCPVGGIVLEPFLGSGSTLIAAEQLSRRCYGIEMDPRYIDAIIQRWEALTKKEAQLL